MRKLNVLLGAAILAAGIGFGGMTYAAPETTPAAAPAVSVDAVTGKIQGKVLGSHVIELPVITEIDYAKGLAADDRMFGQYGCSAIAKTLDTGDTIVGRSMDLFYSNRPAYVIRTAVPGCYKTVGLAYNPLGGPTFEEVEASGISQEDVTSLLFFTTDNMNEKGLYIESNMRPGETEAETGIKPSSGTNPGAKYRMSFAALPRYLIEHAATVDEAVALAETIDVHGIKTKDLDWCGAIYMADKSGHRGLLELVDNKLVWTDGAPGQANFYIHDAYKDKALYGSGYGRFDLLTKEIGNVKTEKDMMDLIYKVRYTQIMNPATCAFDPVTEFTGLEHPELAELGKLTAKAAMDPANHDKVIALVTAHFDGIRDMSMEDLRNDGKNWHSVFQVVANCNKENLHVMFFEDPKLVFDFAVEK